MSNPLKLPWSVKRTDHAPTQDIRTETLVYTTTWIIVDYHGTPLPGLDALMDSQLDRYRPENWDMIKLDRMEELCERINELGGPDA